MSENIESKLKIHKFGKPKQPQSVFPEHMSDDLSKIVHESTN